MLERGARLAAIAVLLLLQVGCRERPRPNLVIYLIDTLRADRLGAYGYDRPTSPVIDALAARGALFERAYAADTRTLGSLPSLLTSLHVPSHGVDRFGDRISDDATTLAEVLARHGYDTASFVTNVNAGSMAGLDRGFGLFHDAIKTHRDREALRSFPEAAFFEWLDRGRDGPFFAYVHTAEPHRPYTPPSPFAELFGGAYGGSVTGYFKGPGGYRSARSAEDVAHVRALYDGEVRFADDALGRLLAGLETRGHADDTIVIVTSDHGEELYDRGGWNHGHSLYDELLRVPLVVAGTNRIDPGRRIAEPVQLVDVAPTALDLLGLPVPTKFQGESLVPLIDGDAGSALRSRSVFAMTTMQPIRVAVVKGRYKCVLGLSGTLELYDLLADPGERTNLAADKARLARSLVGEIRRWMDDHARAAEDEPAARLTDEEEARLRALGYLE